MSKFLLGISGGAGAGKDTLYTLLSERVNCKRVALADSLKSELRPFILEKFSIDLFDCPREEKDLVRPILVEYARVKRRQSPDYFIKKVHGYVTSCHTNIVITDIRYLNEIDWLKNLGGKLVHIKKYKEIDGKRVYSEPFIPDEIENDPKLQAAADYKIEWPEVKDIKELSCYADELLLFLNHV